MTEAERKSRFYRLLWPHVDGVVRTARLLCAHDADGDDLAQETLLKAFRSIDSLRSDGRAKAWLMAILRNAHVDRVRSAPTGLLSLEGLGTGVYDATAAASGDADFGAPGGTPESLLEGFSDRQLILALRSLPRPIRWTLLLVDVQGMDDRDAASVLDVPVGTVKSRAHRGRAMLRAALSPPLRQAPPLPASGAAGPRGPLAPPSAGAIGSVY